MKKHIALIIIAVFILSIFCSCSVKTPQEYYSSNSKKSNQTVNVKIDCTTALSSLPKELQNSEYIPSDGIIFDSQVEYTEGDTAFTILTKATKENKIQLDYNGEGSSIYVQGISHLYEFSCGSLSGWMFSVNGVFAETGCNSITVKPNDTVLWQYTCDLGEDIGNSYKGE